MKKAVTKPTTGKSSKTGTTPAKRPVAKAVAKPAVAKSSVAKKVVSTRKPAAKPVAKSAVKTTRARTGNVLQELQSLAKELNKAAKGLGKASGENPKTVANILGSVERMTSDAANKSLQEAEAAKGVLDKLKDNLGKDWSRKDVEAALKGADAHLTNIIVAQEFQDLAGQAIRKAMKALVGAIIVVEGGGSTEDSRLSQNEVDNLLNELMP
ncbi:MAG TPA: hypothetical protein VGK09_12125 [Rhodocyclaceae bacterium]|jgi:chemotaxis regulatin CheY-phosphate phosphatase CheZ